MIHIKTTIDLDGRTPVRRNRSAAEVRQALAEIQIIAAKIRSGDYDSAPVSPRQIARYGRHIPMQVALRNEVGYRRTFSALGHRIRPLIGNAERESWIELKERKAAEARQARRRWVRR